MRSIKTTITSARIALVATLIALGACGSGSGSLAQLCSQARAHRSELEQPAASAAHRRALRDLAKRSPEELRGAFLAASQIGQRTDALDEAGSVEVATALRNAHNNEGATGASSTVQRTLAESCGLHVDPS